MGDREKGRMGDRETKMLWTFLLPVSLSPFLAVRKDHGLLER
jgi:hypothetical protein